MPAYSEGREVCQYKVVAEDRNRVNDMTKVVVGNSWELEYEFSFSQQASPLVNMEKPTVWRAAFSLMENAYQEKALRESEERFRFEERFRLLVECVKDYAIFMLDPSGRVVSWNAGAERLKGYRAEEIIGEHFSRFYPLEDVARGKPEQELKTAAAEGRIEDEGWRVRKDGSRFWANAVITALRDSAGNLRGFGKVTRDITERRRAEESRRAIEERFRAVAETAHDAIVSADSRGNISYFNNAAERIFGYPAADVLGKPLTVLMPERFHDAHGRGLARFLSTGEAHVIGKTVELTGKRKDGSEFPLELSLASWKSGEQTFFTAIIRDVTERKRAEEALELHRAELARSNTELAATNKELEAFTYSVSHDLRAPLRHVDGFSKILVEEFGPQLDSNAQHCLQRIQEGVRQMGRLVDDLLNLGRVGRQALIQQRTVLNSVVLEVLAELKPETEGREIEWRIGDLPVVQCDPGLMKLVFTNLLSNAIKFTRPQKGAVIEVGQITADGQPTIFVRDNGIGFNMRYAHKLFGIFQRLHRQEDFEGTGVGLANVQRIIHKHGGRVWAEAEPYKGATFYFTLGGFEATRPQANATLRAGTCQTTR